MSKTAESPAKTVKGNKEPLVVRAKTIARLLDAEGGTGYGIDELELHRIVHPRYIANKKYPSPETIGAILVNNFHFQNDEDFFLNSLRRVASRKNLEVVVETFDDEKSCLEQWDLVKV